MRKFALGVILGLVALNCFLAYSGQALAFQMHRVVAHDGIKLSIVSMAAFALQPWFYLAAIAAIIVAAVGYKYKLSEQALVYAAFGLLSIDIAGLFISLWGFSLIHFLLMKPM